MDCDDTDIPLFQESVDLVKEDLALEDTILVTSYTPPQPPPDATTTISYDISLRRSYTTIYASEFAIVLTMGASYRLPGK